MITTVLAIKVLTRIAEDPQCIGRLVEQIGAMPNIPTATMGGTVFWRNIANVKGWRLQQNIIFGNCRILDPNNVRRAWGGETAMKKAFQSLE
ncbi:hypothetical protein ACN4EE_06285 [Geminocystis sp. CENA526]|uniref:hypothetical protein n=1 Tax=Geminocystis sp. CENA526 TaxID=1355871 RepID=UPI003D6DD3BA